MVSSLYRKLLPLSARQFVYDFFLGKLLFFAKHFKVIVRSKLSFVFDSLLPKTEENKTFALMGRHGLTSCLHNS
jgi:hypothetical protein